MSTVVKNIRQHSFEIPQFEEFQLIAERYTAVKNYVYSRFSGIQSLTKLKTYKKEIRDLWTAKAGGFADQWKLPARYWKLALDEAISGIKSEWSNTKNRVREAIRKNENLTEDERKYLYYVLKADGLLQAVLTRKEVIRPQKIVLLVVREHYIHNLLRRYIRRYKGSIPYSHKQTTFQIDANMYEYVLKDNQPYIEISALTKFKRIPVLLKDKQRHSGNLRIVLKENQTIEIHRTKQVKVKKQSFEPHVLGVDKGYTSLFATSTDKEYGKDLHHYLTKETERLNVKNSRRQYYWQLARDCESAGDFKKAERIRSNNLGKVKYHRQRNKYDSQMKSYINHEIRELIFNEKPTVIVAEELTFQSWNKKLKKGTKRKLNRWVKGYIQERLSYICSLYGVKLELINPAYTSQICHQCGAFGYRNGKTFTCSEHGVMDADLNAAHNIEHRLNDKLITQYTSYQEVKRILLERLEVKK